MGKEFFIDQERYRIDWSQVSDGVSDQERLNCYRNGLISLFGKVLQEKNILPTQEISSAVGLLSTLGGEIFADFYAVFGLDAMVYIDVTNIGEDGAGEVFVTPDGRQAMILDEGVLYRAMESALLLMSDGNFSESEIENHIHNVSYFFFDLAHELSHIRQQLSDPQHTESSAPWMEEHRSPTREEMARYFLHPYEANAGAITIRYLRVKQAVGNKIWQTFNFLKMSQDWLESTMAGLAELRFHELEDSVAVLRSGELGHTETLALVDRVIFLREQISDAAGNIERMKDRIADLDTRGE